MFRICSSLGIIAWSTKDSVPFFLKAKSIIVRKILVRIPSKSLDLYKRYRNIPLCLMRNVFFANFHCFFLYFIYDSVNLNSLLCLPKLEKKYKSQFMYLHNAQCCCSLVLQIQLRCDVQARVHSSRNETTERFELNLIIIMREIKTIQMKEIGT